MSCEKEVVEANQQLLKSIDEGDYQRYLQLVSPELSCFEPEAGSNQVTGMAFHETFFKLPRGSTPPVSSMSATRVRVLPGEQAAVVSYVRLTQVRGESGVQIKTAEETRVWEKQKGAWRNVHFHRSQNVTPELKDSGVYSSKAKL